MPILGREGNQQDPEPMKMNPKGNILGISIAPPYFRRIANMIVLLLIINLAACMNMRVAATYDSNNPVPEKVTKWTFIWGLVQPKDIETDSNCESICIVTAKNNLGYILISAATLGLAVPLSIEYQCCAFDPGEGDI